MTQIASTSGRPAPAAPRIASPRPTAQPRGSGEDVGAMRQALERARGPGERVGPRAGKGELKGATDAKELARLRGEEPEENQVALAPRGEGRAGRFDDADQDRRDGSPLSLAATAQAAVQPIAVPDAPAPHVDPAAFAQLMTQLWLRERGKGTKEVRVTFGDDAWPATGARLVRNAAGALDVQLHVADGGALYEGEPLAGLGRDLAATGLAIGALSLGGEAA